MGGAVVRPPKIVPSNCRASGGGSAGRGGGGTCRLAALGPALTGSQVARPAGCERRAGSLGV